MFIRMDDVINAKIGGLGGIILDWREMDSRWVLTSEGQSLKLGVDPDTASQDEERMQDSARLGRIIEDRNESLVT